MVNALEAGTIVAVMAGVTGWFMVLRRQTFAGHTLSVIAFPGAAAATLAGLPLASATSASAALGRAGRSPRSPAPRRSLERRDRGDRHVQALALALGFLFVSLYHGILERPGLAAVRHLPRHHRASGAWRCSWSPSARRRLRPGRARPLLFASVDPDVARASGVPVRLLGLGFLLVLGLAVAETSQITGALLVFALLVTPAATAQRLTSRPGLGIGALGRDRARRHLARARASPTSRSTRSASTSPRSRSRSTCSSASGALAVGARSCTARRGRLMFAHEFMRNALLAGTFVGLACGLVGYFVVLRAQVFAGDALSHVAFTGALARGRARDRHPRRPVRRDDPRRHRDRRCSATAPAPTTS